MSGESGPPGRVKWEGASVWVGPESTTGLVRAEWHGPVHAARPLQEFPAHPGKQIFFAPGRVRIPCGGHHWVVFTKCRVICQPLLSRCNDRADAKKIRRHGAKLPKLVVFHFCPTVQLPIWSTLWYFTFEYLSQLGMETTKR